MSVAVLLRIGIVVTGLLIMWQSFYMHAVKKLAINLAVAWEGIGIGLILVGAIPVLSAWCYQVGEGTAVAMFLVGAVAVWSGYELSIQISVLSMKMQEIAMQVSLLNQENERIENNSKKLSYNDEKEVIVHKSEYKLTQITDIELKITIDKIQEIYKEVYI